MTPGDERRECIGTCQRGYRCHAAAQPGMWPPLCGMHHRRRCRAGLETIRTGDVARWVSEVRELRTSVGIAEFRLHEGDVTMKGLSMVVFVVMVFAGVVCSSCGPDSGVFHPPPDFSARPCDAHPVCGDGAVPPFVFEDLGRP